MISTTTLAADLKVGSMLGRRQRVSTRLVRPDGRIFVKVTTKGGGSTVSVFQPDEYVRTYEKV